MVVCSRCLNVCAVVLIDFASRNTTTHTFRHRLYANIYTYL